MAEVLYTMVSRSSRKISRESTCRRPRRAIAGGRRETARRRRDDAQACGRAGGQQAAGPMASKAKKSENGV